MLIPKYIVFSLKMQKLFDSNDMEKTGRFEPNFGNKKAKVNRRDIQVLITNKVERLKSSQVFV